MKKNPSLLIILLAFFAFDLAAQDTDVSVKYAQTIKEEDLKAHMSIVASDSFEGRGTAEKGQKLAAAYIANQFQLLGLSPVVQKGDSLSYFQSFAVYKRSWDNPYIKVNDKEKTFLKDFFSIARPSFTEEEELDLVFKGYLDDITADKKDDSYKGKGVVLFLGKVEEKDALAYSKKLRNQIITSNNNKKLQQLLDGGAKGVFLIPGFDDRFFESFLGEYSCQIEESSISTTTRNYPSKNIFFISPSLGSELLNVSMDELNKLYQKSTSNNPEFKKVKTEAIKIKASQKVESLETENVLGYIEGTDKKDEVLVITAHYDHEGIKCGEIYNGADDDGSGTVTILELAQAFSFAKKEGKGPRRSILFMTVTAEEKGLLGSQYYVENPVFPLSQTIANLNIDMIGRLDEFHTDENYVYLIGSNRLSKQLHQISEEANFKYTNIYLDYKYNAPNDPQRFYYRSDHYNFAKNNVPVIFYFSGTHEDYHQPTDDIEKILFGKIEKTARLIFHTAWELTNREERITVDVAK